MGTRALSAQESRDAKECPGSDWVAHACLCGARAEPAGLVIERKEGCPGSETVWPAVRDSSCEAFKGARIDTDLSLERSSDLDGIGGGTV